MDNWTATKTNSDQGANFREVKIYGKVSLLEFTINPRSEYWRAGFKLIDPNTSILPIRNKGSLLFHLSSNTNDKYGFTAYYNGEWVSELNKTKFYPKDRLLTIRLEIDHGNKLKIYVNGSLEFKPIWKIENPNIREKVVLIAWGDAYEYKVDFSKIKSGNWKDVDRNKLAIPWYKDYIKLALIIALASLVVGVISIPWWPNIFRYVFRKNAEETKESSKQSEPRPTITTIPTPSYNPIETSLNSSSISVDEGKSYTDQKSGITLGVNFVLSKFYAHLTITFPKKPSEEFIDVKSGKVYDYIGLNGLKYKLTIIGIESDSVEILIRQD